MNSFCKALQQMENSEIFPVEVLAKMLGFPNAHQEFWWNKTAKVLANLMISAKYDVELQYKYLALYYEYILPMLGPSPTAGDQPHWKSFCTDDYSPVEPSWNCHGSESTIRFSFEPVGYLASTKMDPFNQLAVKQFIRRVQQSSPDLDVTWFNHFEKEFFIQEENYEEVCAKVQASEHMTQSFIAFDLNGGEAAMKVYLFPILKSLQTGISTATLVSNAIRRLDEPKGLTLIPALSILEAWIESMSSQPAPPKVEMLSFDCTEPHLSRIKIYVRIPQIDFKSVVDAYTLGGRLQDSATKSGVSKLQELWQFLFEFPHGVTDNLETNGHRTAGMIFNFEIKPGACFPSPQVYIPVRHYAKSDLQISKALSSFFERQGWSDLAQSYTSNLASIFPTHPLAEGTGTHTYISFSYKKKGGVYVTMYYSPRVYNT